MTEINRRGMDGNAPTVRRSRLWLWFIAGFLLVFLGMSILFSMDFYDGHAVYNTKVWHYYVLEIERAWNSTGNLGPTSGNSTAAVTIAVQHILFSISGGAVMMGIGWTVRKMARTK
jgi:uncharacterized membrane protein